MFLKRTNTPFRFGLDIVPAIFCSDKHVKGSGPLWIQVPDLLRGHAVPTIRPWIEGVSNIASCHSLANCCRKTLARQLVPEKSCHALPRLLFARAHFPRGRSILSVRDAHALCVCDIFVSRPIRVKLCFNVFSGGTAARYRRDELASIWTFYFTAYLAEAQASKTVPVL